MQGGSEGPVSRCIRQCFVDCINAIVLGVSSVWDS